MIRKRFLQESARQELLVLARDASAAHGLARRANAIVLLDRGMSCEDIAAVLLIDDDTVRRWHGLYAAAGLAGLARLGHEGRECRLSDAQQIELKAWITETLPRSSREVGAFIAAYGNLLNHLAGDEVVLFGDAVHPTHQAQAIAHI